MGLDVFENDNHFQTVPRAKIVNHPPRNRAKVDEKDIKALLKSRYYNLKLDNCSRELRLSNSISPRRKSMPARHHSAQDKKCETVYRGSVYQSSREIRSMRAITEGRRNVETSFSDEAFLSFDIVDPIPCPYSNEFTAFPPLKKSPLRSLGTESIKCTEFQELSFRDLSEEHVKLSSECSGSGQQVDSLKDGIADGLRCKDQRGKVSAEEQKSERDNILSERDNRCNLPKSFSAKEVMFNPPPYTQLEKALSKAIPKTRFSPFKKMLDPIMKSKSLRNPSHMETEIGSSIKRHRVRASPKSLLNDFSKATDDKDYHDGSTKRDRISTTVSSAAHLHAILKLDCTQVTPSYEFAIKDHGDVLLAKTWRTDNTFDWVYTFHSSMKKNVNSSGWKFKERHGHSPPMIGQMQVSCYFCSEVISENGLLESSIVTEFVLHDVAQARRGSAMRESLVTHAPSERRNSTETEKSQYCHRHPSNDFDSDPSTSYPWALSDLHPNLEIAAIVIQIPFNKKEMKEMQVEDDKIAKDTTFECTSYANVKVMVASGTHGLPSNEEGGPASLLNRWRCGGGCDCGGWDMACPIVLLHNNYANDAAKGDQQQMVLSVQGRKGKTPALSITADGNRQFLVDFHAQLSSLQAFSICIAVLHGSEAASALGHENKHGLYSSSLKLLLEEEVRHLLEAVAEEKRKTQNKIEQLSQSFILDLPFSPMGRA